MTVLECRNDSLEIDKDLAIYLPALFYSIDEEVETTISLDIEAPSNKPIKSVLSIAPMMLYLDHCHSHTYVQR